jgi:hypothetical protein
MIPFGRQVRDARKLEKIGYHATGQRDIGADVTS